MRCGHSCVVVNSIHPSVICLLKEATLIILDEKSVISVAEAAADLVDGADRRFVLILCDHRHQLDDDDIERVNRIGSLVWVLDRHERAQVLNVLDCLAGLTERGRRVDLRLDRSAPVYRGLASA